MAAAIPDLGVHDLVRRAACLPYGLSLVEFGLPVCVSQILGVSAEAVARVRAELADAAARPALVGEYENAVARREEDPEAFCRQCTAEGRIPSPGCPLALIREAETQPSGMDALRSASLEAAAVIFKAHPFVILGAREWLARRTTAGTS